MVSEQTIQEHSQRWGYFVSSSHFPYQKVPKPWQREPFVLPEIRGRAFRQCRDGERKNQKNIKKFRGTPPLLNRDHPVNVSRLSRGNVPSVPWTFCPIYVELRINQVGTSRMSWDSPPNRPQDTSEARS